MNRDTGRDIVRRLVLCLCLLLAGGLASGCTASENTKRGGPGEFCNGSDSECRTGLVCERGVCAYPNQRHQVCQNICDRFEQCQANLGSCSDRNGSGNGLEVCYQDCLETLDRWGRDQVMSYQRCYRQDLSCSEIRSSQCPQNICYQRLELDESRVETCDQMEGSIERCYESAGADPSEKIDVFDDACQRRARTASDSDWNSFSSCQEAFTQNGDCTSLFECFNTELPLGPDEEFPTSAPPGGGGTTGSGTGSSPPAVPQSDAGTVDGGTGAQPEPDVPDEP